MPGAVEHPAPSSTRKPRITSSAEFADSARRASAEQRRRKDSECVPSARLLPAPTSAPSSSRAAIPFQLSPKDGQRISEMAAASAFGVSHVFRLVVSRFLRRWFGFDLGHDVRQIAFKPLLVPVWKVDLAMKGKAVVGDVEMELNITALDSALPGFRLHPLSSLTVSPPFAVPPVPFDSAAHLTQFDTPITLLPLTQHPLNLVSKLQSFPRKFSSDGTSLDPKQFSPRVFAAYPMYLPLYLGEFALDEGPRPADLGGVEGDLAGERRVTTAAFATVDGPAFAVYPQFLDPPAWLPPSDSVNLSISARPLPSSVSSSPADAAASSASTSDLQPRLLEAFSEFKDEAEEGGFELLDRIEGGEEGAVELVRKSGRAMAFGGWAEANREYVEAQEELDKAQALYEQVESMPDSARALLIGKGVSPRLSSKEDFLADVTAKLDDAKAHASAARPDWIARVEKEEREEREKGLRERAGAAARGRPQ
ncbi:hypothetical protein Rhopal_001735-T1 [Rhodotorula paludigena]|uniref:Proteophosphoglycan ppg4 n=1 Tax=Rhodotorula paludigena TaxID=86838 RepID=A0AAV5GGS8_9BASI|nr:hypothetical protein Rhopal_001735-T1 [Rhodotorula paludigena]